MNYYLKLLLVVNLFLAFIFSQSLNKSLKILCPLVGKKWVGSLWSPDGENEHKIERRFTSIWDGNAVKIEKSIKDLNNFGEGYIYWDDIEKKIAFFYIENSGVWQEGYIDKHEYLISLEGKITWPTKTNQDLPQEYKFRNTFEFTKEGTVIDRWYYNITGSWLGGHIIEYKIN